jgi:hypothetical protein
MTASSELVFGEVSHNDSDRTGLREWALRGPDGVVNFLAAGTMGLVIGVHQPVAGDDDSPGTGPCDLLGGRCRGDMTYLGAVRLAEHWQAAGGDKTMIRAELESWYAAHLAPGGELS